MNEPAEQQSVADWLGAEPFTLVFSSGFFGFFAHAGMLRALERAGIRPAGVGGSSAGALVAGLWGAGLDSEEICERLVALRRADFWDPGPGLGLLTGRRFRSLLDDSSPVSQFEDRTVPVRLSVFDLGARRTEIIERGELSSAIHASCAFPFLFHPVRIAGARDRSRWQACSLSSPVE
jgi:NTE family protein